MGYFSTRSMNRDNNIYKVNATLSKNCTVNETIFCKQKLTKGAMTNLIAFEKDIDRIITAVKNGWLEIKKISLNGEDITNEIFKEEPTQNEQVEEPTQNEQVEEPTQNEDGEDIKIRAIINKIIEEQKDSEDGKIHCPYCDKVYNKSYASKSLYNHIAKEHSDSI